MEMKAVKMAVKRPPDPSTGGEILDQSVPETKKVVAAVCFAKAPTLLGQAFFLVYEGVRPRPEARRCPRPIWRWGAHAARYRGRVRPPLLALRHPLVSILLSIMLLFQKKVTWYFSRFYFMQK